MYKCVLRLTGTLPRMALMVSALVDHFWERVQVRVNVAGDGASAVMAHMHTHVLY